MKKWYQSKTLWVNAIAAMLVALEGVFGVLQPYLPVDFYAALAVVLPIVNALLRVVTSKALAFSS